MAVSTMIGNAKKEKTIQFDILVCLEMNLRGSL